MENTEKPNFEKLAINGMKQYRGDLVTEAFTDGCERIWTDYVEPLQAEIEALQKETGEVWELAKKTQRELEQIEEENRWRNDTIPDDLKKVLVYDARFESIELKHCTVEKFLRQGRTHWRKLPSPPKAEQP